MTLGQFLGVAGLAVEVALLIEPDGEAGDGETEILLLDEGVPDGETVGLDELAGTGEGVGL